MKRALVISLICVLGLAVSGLAATLSGSWDTDVSIDPQQTSFDLAIGLTSVLTVTYTIGDWSFSSVSKLSENGWTDQDFSVAGVLGAFSITSALDFVPAAATFGSWKTTAGVAIAGVSFGASFELADHDVELILTGSGVAGDVTVSIDVTFGGIERTILGVIVPDGNNDECDLDWAGVTVNVGFPFCCADVSLAVKFDCTGFVSATLGTQGIAIPNLPWVTLDATIVYTMTDKQLYLAPTFDWGATVCFDLYINFEEWDPTLSAPDADGFILETIRFEGIGLTCDIGAVTFTGLSFWGDGVKPGLLYLTDYWEVYQIATNDDGCCGPFAFDLAFYFVDNGDSLFDIAEIDANMSLQIASQFLFDMGLTVDVDGGAFTSWTIGFLVTW